MAWPKPERKRNAAAATPVAAGHADAQLALPGGMTALEMLQRTRPAEGTGPGVWMFSYIDLLTLLLSLFAILLAFQQQDRPVIADIGVETHAAPPTEAPTDAPGAVPVDPAPAAVPTAIDIEQATAPPQPDLSARAAPAPDAQALLAAEALLVDSEFLTAKFDDEIFGTGITVAVTPDIGLPAGPTVESEPPIAEFEATDLKTQLPVFDDRVTAIRQSDRVLLEVRDSILFAPARARLTAEGSALLDELAEIFRRHQGVIVVEGHTDDRPIRTTAFASNWELSSARASRVARHLIDRGIAPEALRVVGYADTRPLMSNGTADGRARNRRVSFVLHESAPEAPRVSATP